MRSVIKSMYLPAYRKICMAGLFLVLVFFAGRFSKDDDSKEVEDLRKKERVMFQQQIIQKQVQIQGLIEAQQEIRQKMYADSLRFSEALNVNKRAYSALKKKYNEINLHLADAHLLDSLINGLYSETAD